MQDTSIRLIHLLKMVPRRGRKAVREFQSDLQALGYDVTLRTVQRDLEKLSGHFPIQSDGAKPSGWSWAPQAADVSLPMMDSTSALSLLILQKHVRHLLPPQVLDELRPKFEEARKVLERQPESGLKRWPDRIAVTSRSLPMIPPDISPATHRIVFDALARRKQLLVDYRGFGREESKQYSIHPLGLIAREGVMYVVALVEDYDDPRPLALHRILSVECAERPARDLPDFDIDTFVDEGGVSVATGRIVELIADFTPEAGVHLRESRIAPNHRVEEVIDSNGSRSFRLTATVRESLQLKWWLQSFGKDLISVAMGAAD